MFRDRLIETAQSIGADPLDLATVISYETGGTFDPKQPGPTTQWGQHRGLIQFGEPQARQHGVNWDDPLNSQLGPDGAVASYLRSSGYQPGMGLLDLYSTVNAGAPGLYNRSDANNGGAPGTVRDKVEQQMAGHRQNAMRLLGTEAASTKGDTGMQQRGLLDPTPQQQPQQEQGGFRAAMKNPEIWEAIALAANTLRHQPDQQLAGVIENRRGRRAESQQEQQQRNQTAEWLRSQGRDDLAQAVETGSVTGRDAFKVAMQRPESDLTTGFQTLHQRAVAAGHRPGSPEYQQMMMEGSSPQTNINVNTGRQDDMWGEPESGNVWLRDPEGNVVTEPSEDGRGVRPVQVPISGGQVERDIASSEREGQARAGTRGRVGGTAVDEMNLLLDGLGYDAETGQFGESRIAGPRERVLIGSGEDQGFLSRLAYGGTESIDWMNTLQSLQDTIAIDRLLEIKEAGSGLGQVPQSQLRALARAMGNLDPSSSDKLIGQNLLRARSIYEDVVRQSLEDRDDPTFRGLMEEIVPEARAFLQPTGGQQQPGGGQVSGQPPQYLVDEDKRLWPFMTEEERRRILEDYEGRR